MLYQLHLGQNIITHPTVGSNVEQVKHGKLTFEVDAASLRTSHGMRSAPQLAQPHLQACKLLLTRLAVLTITFAQSALLRICFACGGVSAEIYIFEVGLMSVGPLCRCGTWEGRRTCGHHGQPTTSTQTASSW